MNYALAIKEKIHTRDLLSAFGIPVGRNGMVCCPIHGEKTPSMKVYDDPMRGWYCFGCHRGGDVIDMAQALWRTGFMDTMRQLNDDFALGLPIDGQMTAQERRRMAQEIERIRAKRAEQKAREEAAEQAYWAAYDAWLSNENEIIDQAPKTRDEDFSDAFAQAIARRAELEDAMDSAQDRWREVLRARNEHKDASMAKERIL